MPAARSLCALTNVDFDLVFRAQQQLAIDSLVLDSCIYEQLLLAPLFEIPGNGVARVNCSYFNQVHL